MGTLALHANNILGLFGNLPECLLDLEDSANAFLRARKYYWQQLGISSMDLKVTSIALDLSAQVRDFALPTSPTDLSNVYPAFVEMELFNNNARRVPVDVIPLEDVINHESERALSLYNSPNRIRLAWDAWSEGVLFFFYDPTSDIANLTLESDIDFPPAFFELLENKAAYNLVSLANSKEAREAYREQRQPNTFLVQSLTNLKADFAVTIAEWQREFDIWRNTDKSEGSYERRSDVEMTSNRTSNFNDDEFLNAGVGIG